MPIQDGQAVPLAIRSDKIGQVSVQACAHRETAGDVRTTATDTMLIALARLEPIRYPSIWIRLSQQHGPLSNPLPRVGWSAACAIGPPAPKCDTARRCCSRLGDGHRRISRAQSWATSPARARSPPCPQPRCYPCTRVYRVRTTAPTGAESWNYADSRWHEPNSFRCGCRPGVVSGAARAESRSRSGPAYRTCPGHSYQSTIRCT